jgi:plastocyanin
MATGKAKAVAALSTVGVAVVAAMAANGAAGPENITFPAGYDKWERYGTVDRYDSKQYRELYARPEVVKAVREGKPVPHGAVLAMAIYAAKLDDNKMPVKDANGRFVKDKLTAVTVMEKRRGWADGIPNDWRNGDWQYASFMPDGKPNAKANGNIKACFDCHKPHEKQDFVISLASLSGTMPGGVATRPKGPGVVSIGNFLFGPERITVKAGQTITWTNVDDSPHQVTVQGETTLRTPVILKGQTTALAFNDVGTYGYICGLHPAMKGQIEVTK